MKTYLHFVLLLFIFCFAVISDNKKGYSTAFMVHDYSKQKAVFFDEVIGGKQVLVNFWATYCEPCKKEIPILLEKFGNNKKVQLVFINIDEGQREKVKEFISLYKIEKYSFLDPYQIAAKEFIKPKFSVPANIVFNKEGEIVLDIAGFQETTIQKISEVVNKLK
jgi:cytochrome c biogenesis protein CcmG, thiol:disulfide interchange protein DsbE